MKITFECECGNNLVVLVKDGKYAQLRDYLESKQFRFEKAIDIDSKLVEFRLLCEKCKNHITLGVD